MPALSGLLHRSRHNLPIAYNASPTSSKYDTFALYGFSYPRRHTQLLPRQGGHYQKLPQRRSSHRNNIRRARPEVFRYRLARISTVLSTTIPWSSAWATKTRTNAKSTGTRQPCNPVTSKDTSSFIFRKFQACSFKWLGNLGRINRIPCKGIRKP